MRILTVTSALLFLFFVAACSAPPTRTAITDTNTLTPTALTDTPASNPTAVPTDTATPVPLDPLTIESLRARDYPGSDIHIEQTLTPGRNYQRYIASYVSDGLKIYALMTVPNGPRPKTGYPVIIFNHGYIPPKQYRTTERYVAYVDGFATNGYIVFKSDYRGHGSSEGTATGGYGTPDYTVDVLNALASLKRYKDADPNRIGMWGHSMGGLVTLRAMVVSKDIKAGVIWSGVVAPYVDILEHWHMARAFPTPTVGRHWREEFISQYGTPEENPGFWNSISPNSYLDDISGPLQLHHSTADPEVPYEFSVTLRDELTAAGKMVEFYSYNNDDHNLSKSFTVAMRRSVDFFNRYLK